MKSKSKTVDGVTFVCTHAGQKKAYGDTYYEYSVTSDRPADEVENFCAERVCKAISKKQYTDEYRAKPTAGNHFRLHYTFNKRPDGSYFYSVCSPWTD